jgi:hypothetical protein
MVIPTVHCASFCGLNMGVQLNVVVTLGLWNSCVFGEISGFCREEAENGALLGYYAASSGNLLPMFRDNLLDSWTRRMGPIGCPETSVRSYHYSLRNDPEERISRTYFILLNLLFCASGWSLVQRGPNQCGVSECDREASVMRRPWPCIIKKLQWNPVITTSVYMTLRL